MTSLSTIARRLSVVVCSVLLMVGTFFLSAAPASAASHDIAMGGAKGLVFEPASLTIASGDTVNFAVGQLPPHNVVFESVPGGDKDLAAKLSHKGLEGNGASFSIDFAGAPAGDYSFFCMPHRGAGMVGKITVQ
ncbi:plastocyanin [filamentous cyanobacterium LEGE 11480]|uniref:Plastocyanin n=1 Tax=Romeriopsis navalis LEGE 11480 TaxID=2777977 RepID=A0A928VLP3_9CYAN|nr:plastocyanin [Romeriopsis navalis]MBE9030898.1 plastocyanin [Romeriopsis navalis LEGE 11480]